MGCAFSESNRQTGNGKNIISTETQVINNTSLMSSQPSRDQVSTPVQTMAPLSQAPPATSNSNASRSTDFAIDEEDAASRLLHAKKNKK